MEQIWLASKSRDAFFESQMKSGTIEKLNGAAF